MTERAIKSLPQSGKKNKKTKTERSLWRWDMTLGFQFCVFSQLFQHSSSVLWCFSFMAPWWTLQRPLLEQSLDCGLLELTLGRQHQVPQLKCWKTNFHFNGSAKVLVRGSWCFTTCETTQSHRTFASVSQAAALPREDNTSLSWAVLCELCQDLSNENVTDENFLTLIFQVVLFW